MKLPHLTRDDLKWPIAQILAGASMVTSGVLNVPALGAYLGITVSTVAFHWVFAVATVILYIASSMRTSPLPGAKS
jgi:hypothetical protein